MFAFLRNLIMAFIIVVAGLFLFMRFQIYTPLDSEGEAQIFRIEKGTGVLEISENLQEKGLIKHKYAFAFYVFLRDEGANLKAGEYRLSPALSVKEIAEIIIEGKTEQERITIVEGWNLIDIARYFEARDIATEQELYEVVGFPRVDYSLEPQKPQPKEFEQYAFLQEKPENISLEGYLFPDTYFIGPDKPIEEIISIFLKNFERRISPDITKEIQRQNKTLFEVLTMASLIEKEVRTQEDMEMVSGILWKRLEIGMPLQVDATITYLTGKKSTRVSIAETRIDSPYNAYKYRGLPIGPICNPGIASIKAALNPKESPYLYYLSTPEGETLYSRTLEEHNIKKAEHLSQ